MNSKESKSRLSLPLLLSALVCPGIGQYTQKRRVAGILFVLLFSGATLWLLVEMGCYVWMAVLFFLSGAEGMAPRFPLVRITILLTLAAGIYTANLADVFWAERRVKKVARDGKIEVR